jgi:uncharacterized protein YabN with tetrapyrrole methylase and pyrophosphatase domain
MTEYAKLPCDIVVVGLGISGVQQLTREAEETIKRCTTTFVTETGTGVVEYLETLCPRVVDLNSSEDVGEHRIVIYRRIASEVVSAAVAEPPVCFATYGHPTMFCYPTTLIQRAALVLELEVMVLPGISFLDTLLVDLNFDPGFDGLQLYEATDLLIRRRPIQVDAACVITQAPTTLDAYNRPTSRNLESLTLLQNYLLEFYPADHAAVLVASKPHPLLEPLIQPVTLGTLAAALMPVTQLGTLFIPPVRQREIADESLAERMSIQQANEQLPTSRPGRPQIGPQPS